MMDLQQILVYLAVLAAAFHFGRGLLSGFLDRGCDTKSACGKCSQKGACALANPGRSLRDS